MKKAYKKLMVSWIIGLSFMTTNAVGGEIKVAVASNFSKTIKVLVNKFEQTSGHKIKISTGSTGKHYAQITNGAPYHVFLAADEERPKMLEDQGYAVENTRFTYAKGVVVLWSDNKGLRLGEKILQGSYAGRLAYANPKLAPYGRAAKEVMISLGVWDKYKRKAVRGENIGQTFQFVKSGNAIMGFVSSSQIMEPENKIHGSFWVVPKGLYTGINQQAILLKENTIARAFLLFIKSPEMQNVIKGYGYGVAEDG